MADFCSRDTWAEIDATQMSSYFELALECNWMEHDTHARSNEVDDDDSRCTP